MSLASTCMSKASECRNRGGIVLKEITGSMFADMMISGANNLSNQKSAVDNLNVFPVPDGDTGTNMSLTISACVKELMENRDKGIDEISKILANATLRGARGNSGVILSQLMRGLNKGLSGHASGDAKTFANALKSASESAYRAVMKPTEGTILTVARETAEFAVRHCAETEDVIELFEKTVKAAKRSLDKTPKLLEQLRQAGVVDAGGKGLVCILEGALIALKTGEIVERNAKDEPAKDAAPRVQVPDADIKFAYCTEFLINKSRHNADVFRFKATIEHYGDCMVVIDDDDIVKVHIHTNTPNLVIGEALTIGALTNIKIDNMKYQHNETLFKKNEAEKDYAFIAVAAGNGIIETLKELGVDSIIEGGQTMNPSTEDILNAIENTYAKRIFVFPNNKNIILAAEQAKNLTEKNVTVIPTTSVSQALTALITFDEDVGMDENAQQMQDAILGVKTVQVTGAVRDTQIDGNTIEKGDILGIVDGKIKITGKTDSQVLLDSLDTMVDDDSAVITVFCGQDLKEPHSEDLKSALEEKYPECDISVYDGGQPIYSYIAAVE